jgi:hypothetical protein
MQLIYIIEDSTPIALSLSDYKQCLTTVKLICDDLDADFTDIDELNQLNKTEKKTQDIVAHLMIRKRPKTVQDLLEIRIAVVGNV